MCAAIRLIWCDDAFAKDELQCDASTSWCTNLFPFPVTTNATNACTCWRRLLFLQLQHNLLLWIYAMKRFLTLSHSLPFSFSLFLAHTKSTCRAGIVLWPHLCSCACTCEHTHTHSSFAIAMSPRSLRLCSPFQAHMKAHGSFPAAPAATIRSSKQKCCRQHSRAKRNNMATVLPTFKLF